MKPLFSKKRSKIFINVDLCVGYLTIYGLVFTDGKLCMVFDVVFNLAVMRQSMVNKQLRSFLINMAMMWISQKHNIEIQSGNRKTQVF